MSLHYWSDRVVDVLKSVAEKVFPSELAKRFTDFYIDSWRSGLRTCRTCFALNVFHDLLDDELREMVFIETYITLLEDLRGLGRVKYTGLEGVGDIYVGLLSSIYEIASSREAREFLESRVREVVNSWYMITYYREYLPERVTTIDELGDFLRRYYLGYANDTWYFITYPASRRLDTATREALVKTATYYRALWILHDELANIEHFRAKNMLSGARLAIDVLGRPGAINKVIGGINNMFKQVRDRVEGVEYGEKLVKLYENLIELISDLSKNLV